MKYYLITYRTETAIKSSYYQQGGELFIFNDWVNEVILESGENSAAVLFKEEVSESEFEANTNEVNK